MTRGRSDRDLGAAIEAWMADVASNAVPERLLEESFSRTFATRQVRLYPWGRLARLGRGRRSHLRVGIGAAVALVMVATVAGLLGGGASVKPTPSVTPSPSPTPEASVSASGLTRVSVAPTGAIDVVEPVALVTDGLVVWTLTGTGRAVRIDPATNQAAMSVQLGATSDHFAGIAVDRNGVWVTDSDTKTLYRIDPTSLDVVARIPAGETPKGVVAIGEAVWVADAHGGTVLRIDPSTNAVVASIAVGPTGGSGPSWVASGLGSIWVGVPDASTAVRIDPETNTIVARIVIPGPAVPCGGFAIRGGAVWISSCTESTAIARIDPATDRVVATIDLGGHASTPVLIDGVLWVSLDLGRGVPGSLGRVASATNRIDLELSLGPSFGGGGDMVVAAGSAWVIDRGNDRVVRLSLSAFSPG
ncbi:MAG TPA: hypothetical protein VEX41_03735 [Candidatus Eisenbacteria bacterium]|nr:hypothetical protein [Candidatus Eisenbacteria bacterium]